MAWAFRLCMRMPGIPPAAACTEVAMPNRILQIFAVLTLAVTLSGCAVHSGGGYGYGGGYSSYAPVPVYRGGYGGGYASAPRYLAAPRYAPTRRYVPAPRYSHAPRYRGGYDRGAARYRGGYGVASSHGYRGGHAGGHRGGRSEGRGQRGWR
jgi:hypothetical protein